MRPQTFGLALVSAAILVLSASPVGAGSERTETQPYVSSIINECGLHGVVGAVNAIGDAYEAFGEPLFGTLWPAWPADAPHADSQTSVCLPILPGESTVTISITDDHSSYVAYHYGFHTVAGITVSGIGCSDESAPLLIPPSAEALHLTVLPNGFTQCPGAVGTSGTATVTFA